MENNKLLTSLLTNDLDNAAEILCQDAGTLQNDFQDIANHLIQNNDESLIDILIKTANAATKNQITVCNKIILDLCITLKQNFDHQNSNTYILKDYIHKLQNEIYNIFNVNEKENGLYLAFWHLNFGNTKYHFDEAEEAIKHWELAKKQYSHFREIYKEDYAVKYNWLTSCYNLGLGYYFLKKTEESFSNYFLCLKHYEDNKNSSNDLRDKLELAKTYNNISLVCAKENVADYLTKSYELYYDFYLNESFDIYFLIDNITNVLNRLSDFYESEKDYKNQYLTLKQLYDFATKNLEKRTEQEPLDFVPEYFVAGKKFCKFLINNSSLFSHSVTVTYDKEWREFVKTENKPIDKRGTITNYLTHYYSQTKFIYLKFPSIPYGFATANFLIGNDKYLHKHYDQAIDYLIESVNLFKKVIELSPPAPYYNDDLYDALFCLANSYAENKKVKKAMKLIDEMLEFRMSVYNEDMQNEHSKNSLISAYQDAIKFCEEYKYPKTARKLGEELKKLNT